MSNRRPGGVGRGRGYTAGAMSSLEPQIAAALARLPDAMPPGAAARLAGLVDELVRWNAKVNLTAIRDPVAMIEGHLLDSLAVRPLLEGRSIADVGTGAGFPGLPLAIAEPDRRFTLIDGTAKKIAFVRHAAGLLGLGNVEAVQTRTEDYAPGQGFDTVIARAVGTLDRLVAMAGHLVGEDGVFLALKGRYPKQELDEVPAAWATRVVALDVPGLEKGSRHAVLLRPTRT
ncbi:MAG: 16S rRNA (guanine(527)-N(7))-methyltransferase RsmG [Woeseiaceae bacterium]|nr:16S rRNA (guanine(527)-N(7))-methyltransferase RsmG [Woeseiaceae bacterium]